MENLKRPTALIVDAEEEIRVIVDHFVHQMGYETLMAANAEDALAAVAKHHPEVVVTDECMRTAAGELSRTIKARDPKAHVVVMTSLYSTARYESETYRSFHADGFITKPIDFAVLRDRLRRARRATGAGGQ